MTSNIASSENHNLLALNVSSDWSPHPTSRPESTFDAAAVNQRPIHSSLRDVLESQGSLFLDLLMSLSGCDLPYELEKSVEEVFFAAFVISGGIFEYFDSRLSQRKICGGYCHRE